MEHEMVTAEFRRRALEGDGLFAVAFAIMRLREDLCFGDGTGDRQQGVFERLAMGMDDLAKNVGEINDRRDE